METDLSKTRNELLEELKYHREKAAETAQLRRQLEEAESTCLKLQMRLEEREREFIQKSSDHGSAVEALNMARLIVDRSPVVLFRRKAGVEPEDSSLEYISDNLRQFGYTPEEFFNGEIVYSDIVYEDDKDLLHREIQEFADADLEEYAQEYRIVTKSGEIRWVEDQTSVVRDDAGTKIHNQGILIDITDRKIAEEKLLKSEEKYRRIVETAAEGFLLMDEDFRVVDLNDAFCRMVGFEREALLGRTPLDFITDEFRAYMQSNYEDAQAFESSILSQKGRYVPVLVHGNLLRGDHGEIIGNMAFVTDMTEQKKALLLAGEVQKSLMPQTKPDVTGLDIAGRNVSCDEIGGDYFDFLWRHDSLKSAFSIVVGDISGHGVDSALLMTTARAFLRMRAAQPGTLSEVISEMNNQLSGDVLDTGKFMTLFYLTIDPGKRNLNWVRAGHDPAIVYSPDSGEFEELKGSGIALGVVDDFEYVMNQKEGLKNGQIIAIGTDGIWEAFNKEGHMFGKQRMCDIIQNNANASADEILNAVYAGVNTFMSGTKAKDDITLVVIKVDGS